MARILGSADDFILLSVDNEMRAIYLGNLAENICPVLIERRGNLETFVTQAAFVIGLEANIHNAFPEGAPPEYAPFYDQMREKGYWMWIYDVETIVGISGRETMHQLRALPPAMVNHDFLEYRRGVNDSVLEYACLNVFECIQAFHDQNIVLGNVRPELFYVASNRDKEFHLRLVGNYAEFGGAGKNNSSNNWFWAPQQYAGHSEYNVKRADLYSAAMVFLFWFYRVIKPSPKLDRARRKLNVHLYPMHIKDCQTYAKACVTFMTDGHFDEEEWIPVRNIYQNRCKELCPI